MKINCSYYPDDDDYICTVEYADDIPPDADLEFKENPSYRKNSDNVTKIGFVNCEMIKIPQGIKKSFKNLVKIVLISTKLKSLTKHDLTEYKNLKEFDSRNNKIEFLPGDLFEGFFSLERISFEEQNLKFIEPTILDGLSSLMYVDFGPNYRTDSNKRLSNPKLVNDLLNEKFLAQPLEEWMNQPLSLGMWRHCLKTINRNLTSQIGNLKVEHEKEKVNNNKGLNADLNTFIQDETKKDFRIQIENHEFPAHKFLLAARSPTLAEILKNNPEVENLNLVDTSVEIFEIILKFLYTDELPGDDGTNFLHLFAAAGKLKIKELRDYAASKLMNMINQENAIEVLKLSNKFKNEEVSKKAFNEIKAKYPKVDIKDEWIADGEKIEKLIMYFNKMKEAEKILGEIML